LSIKSVRCGRQRIGRIGGFSEPMGPNTLDSRGFHQSADSVRADCNILSRKLRVDARAPGRQSLDSLWQVSLRPWRCVFVILSSQLRPGQVFDLASSRMALLKLVAFGNSKGARNNSDLGARSPLVRLPTLPRRRQECPPRYIGGRESPTKRLCRNRIGDGGSAFHA